MANIKKEMQQAQKLIKAGKYDEARRILVTVDHPKAGEWLDRLNKIDPQKEGPAKAKKVEGKKRRGILWWLSMVVVACVGLTFCSLGMQAVGIIPSAEERDMTETLVAQTQVAMAAIETMTASVWTATPTDRPTATDIPPTATAIPPTGTNTAIPSATLIPSNTPLPSATAIPSRTPLPSATPLPAATATFTVREEEELIRLGITLTRPIDVIRVEIVDGRANGGERAVIIGYRTGTTDPGEMLGDWAYMMGVVADAANSYDVDLDSIAIITANQSDIMISSVAVLVSDVQAFLNKELTNEQFFNRLTIDGMTGQSSAVTNIPTGTTYYAIEAEVYVRECQYIDNTRCPRIHVLVLGDPIDVIGTVQGDSYRSSTLWYQGVISGDVVYVHSTLLSQSRPATARPTQPPSVNVPSTNNNYVQPGNCSTAVAMGLSAEQAAQAGLDRDGDGQACYGT